MGEQSVPARVALAITRRRSIAATTVRPDYRSQRSVRSEIVPVTLGVVARAR